MPHDGRALGALAAVVLAVAAGLLAADGRANARASDETRRRFHDWLAGCSREYRTRCFADAYVREADAPGGVAAALRVTRPEPGAPVEIVFSPALRLVTPESTLDVRIDRDNWIVLRPGSGWVRSDRPNDYGIADRGVVDALVPAMRRGGRITVRYRDDAGAEASFGFSLRGFTAALAFIDHAGSQRADGPRADSTPTPSTLLCRGNEPFWNLAVRDRTATYRRLGEHGDERRVMAGVMRSLFYLRPPLLVWRGRDAGAVGDLVAVIAKERCADTMSEEGAGGTMPYTALVSMPGTEVLTGCCREEAAPAMRTPEPEDVPVADLAAKPADDWAHQLLDLLPAMEACIRRTPGTAARVSKAWPMNRALVGVRTESDIGRWQCVARGDGGAVFSVAGLGTAPPVPGEGHTIFTPEGTSPLQGHCWRHERVMTPGGRFVGWLSYDVC